MPNVPQQFLFSNYSNGWAVRAGELPLYDVITIPATHNGLPVLSIPASGFANQPDVTEWIVPNGITSIGANAFANNTGLTTITIPNSVTTIASAAFTGASSLESITLPFIGQSRTAVGRESLFGYIFGTAMFSGGTQVTQQSMWSEPSWANPAVHSVTWFIPSGLTSVVVTAVRSDSTIQRGAFMNVSFLEEIIFPKGHISIGIDAFRGLTSITCIDNILHDDVMTIGSGAFFGMSSIESSSLVIPNSIISIGESAFNGWRNVAYITLPFIGQSRTATGRESLFGYIFGTAMFSGGSQVTQQSMWPEFWHSNPAVHSVTWFIPSGLISVVVTDTTRLERGAFMNALNLTSVIISASVTTVGQDVFRGASNATISVVGRTEAPSTWNINWNPDNRPVVWNA